MKLIAVAGLSQALATVSSRKTKITLISDVLRQLQDTEIPTAVAWLAGTLPGGRPGLGPSAIAALRAVPSAAEPQLTIRETQQLLHSLALITGKGSAAGRRAALTRLYEAATAPEQLFLSRLLLGELRQGALEGIMVEAIATAAAVRVDEVRRACMLAGALAPVAEAALTEGDSGLARFRLQLYAPLSPMLASPALDIDSALTALGLAAFEYKIDGARAQIHKHDAGVKVYSRTGRDVTFSLPEIAEAVAALPAHSIILDAEVIAMGDTGSPLPFQETMRRFGRKLDVAGMQSSVPLSLFCFDCLHVDGEDLIDLATEQRQAYLERLVPEKFRVPRLVTDNPEQAREFLHKALQTGHEGVMAKALNAPYEAGRRGSSWLKIKVAHTLDLVVLAAEWGSGRRQGWLSNLHLGARSDDGFVMLGKTFKGLTDELLAWQTAQLQQLAVDGSDGHVVHVRPELVVEIAFNELQTSRRYPGGLALRFARVVRYRPDKTAADADSIETVRALAAGKAPD